MNHIHLPDKLCAAPPFRRPVSPRASAPGPHAAGAEAEAAAFCAMKLADAERRARDGRDALCCV